MLRLAAATAVFLAAGLAAGLSAGAARAGEIACAVDNGAVIVPAAFGDITGDFILDLSAPKSVLHVDRALEAGIITPTTSAPLRLADQRIPATLSVGSIDARSIGFPTTLNGLIGADVLAGYVVDLQLSPCRLGLWRRPPRLRGAAFLPMRMVGGALAIGASVSDGHSALEGPFAIDTASPGVRLSKDAASLSRAPPKGVDPGSRFRPPARLSALSYGGVVLRNAPAGVASDLPPGVLGSLGTRVWSAYRLRIDVRRGVLELAAPVKAPGPSGRRRARSPGS